MANINYGTVYPVFDNEFKVQPYKKNLSGAYEPNDAFKLFDKAMIVAGMTSFSIACDNGIEEFNPMEQKGWVRRLMTAKGFTISLGGKRCFGNEGNDFLATFVYKTGPAAKVNLLWKIPESEDCIVFPVVVNVTSLGGDSTAIDAMEVEFLSDGKPMKRNKSGEDSEITFVDPSAPEV